ncbi:MAG TPA: GTP-binding protein [Stellaceae bacterium]|nr:GTP-binding protein [Stellaceae bacterium]
MRETLGDRLPLTILTGFLGSGKTTVLRHLLTQPEMAETAVVINEFGEVGLDHELVRQGGESTILLASGCVCCTIQSDLTEALRTLFLDRVRGKVPEFRRVIVETTGLADPAPILHTLMTDPFVAARYRLDGIIATIDAVNADAELDVHPEAVKQAAVADRIVLTKTDIATPAMIERVLDRLRAINPAADPIRVVDGVVEPAALLGAGLLAAGPERWLAASAYTPEPDEHGHGHHDHDHHGHEHEAPDRNRHDDRIRAFCLTHEAPLAWSDIAGWLDMLTTVAGPNMLRVKGILWVSDTDRPVVIHGVQHLFHPPVLLDQWSETAPKVTRVVFITRDIPEKVIAGLFDALIHPEASRAKAPDAKAADTEAVGSLAP